MLVWVSPGRCRESDGESKIVYQNRHNQGIYCRVLLIEAFLDQF
jgi:hypothetical protein